MNYRRILSQTALIAGVLLFSAGAQTLAQSSWSPPSVSPPGGDAYAPLNTGPDVQTKVGDICTDAGGGKCLSTAGGSGGGGGGGGGAETDPTVKSWAKTDNPVIPGTLATQGNATFPFIYDANDANYYMDPNGTSRTNYTIANNVYLYGSMTGSVFVGNKWVPDETQISCGINDSGGAPAYYARVSGGKIYLRVVAGHPGIDSGWHNVSPFLIFLVGQEFRLRLIPGGLEGFSIFDPGTGGTQSGVCTASW